ncbi:aldo/keto reductase [Streptomyces sp. NPDC088260]|uniref:aldo/keto reductase n=1 Tax=Streptomyces sp. NPDC088260 TaxID=3365850 RepID=UPI00380839B3
MSLTPPGGTITIAGKTVSRLGLGTMRLTGQGTWGDPDDRHQAIRVLRHAVHTHGITHIDTADAYGPHTCEHLIRDALYPYPDDVLIATKVGMVRPAPNMWAPHGHPVYLRASVEASLRRLDTDRLDLCYLHRIDPEVPLADQLGTLQAMQDEGKPVFRQSTTLRPSRSTAAATKPSYGPFSSRSHGPRLGRVTGSVAPETSQSSAQPMM